MINKQTEEKIIKLAKSIQEIIPEELIEINITKNLIIFNSVKKIKNKNER